MCVCVCVCVFLFGASWAASPPGMGFQPAFWVVGLQVHFLRLGWAYGLVARPLSFLSRALCPTRPGYCSQTVTGSPA